MKLLQSYVQASYDVQRRVRGLLSIVLSPTSSEEEKKVAEVDINSALSIEDSDEKSL